MKIDECIAFLRWKPGKTQYVARFKRMNARNAAFIPMNWVMYRVFPGFHRKNAIHSSIFIDFRRDFHWKQKEFNGKPIIFRFPASSDLAPAGLERPGLEISPISFKNSFWKSTIFDAGSTRTGRASKIIGSQLKSFWKPLVWSGGPGRESPGIEMLEKSFRNLTEILKDF